MIRHRAVMAGTSGDVMVEWNRSRRWMSPRWLSETRGETATVV